MSAKNLSQQEKDLCRAIGLVVAKRLFSLTTRETKSVGVCQSQIYKARMGVPQNFTLVTLSRVAANEGIKLSELILEAEEKLNK